MTQVPQFIKLPIIDVFQISNNSQVVVVSFQYRKIGNDLTEYTSDSGQRRQEWN